jgi:hypothetical protein
MVEKSTGSSLLIRKYSLLNFSPIIIQLDEQIAKLQEVRALLLSNEDLPKRLGRPKGSTNKLKLVKGTRGRISPDGRKRIADAMKARWAAKRKAAATSVKTKARAS